MSSSITGNSGDPFCPEVTYTDTNEGSFGTVITETDINNYFFDGKPTSLRQNMRRYSASNTQKGSLEIEISIISSFDNLHEYISLRPQIIDANKVIWDVSLWFENCNNSFNIQGGNVGVSSIIGPIEITDRMYYDFKSKIIKMLNPECKYSIIEIINLLRSLGDPALEHFFFAWDTYIPEIYSSEIDNSLTNDADLKK